MNYHITNNLEGDRTIEYAYTLSNIPQGHGKRALDIGAGGVGTVALALLQAGYTVDVLDPEDHPVPSGTHKHIGDIRTFQPSVKYDLITLVSTIEHVGLAGRYNVTEHSPDGDIEAMQAIKKLLNPLGTVVLTIPVGVDTVHNPMHRVYGQERLPRLLEGFTIEHQIFWRKINGSWVTCTQDEALSQYSVRLGNNWQGCAYALMGAMLKYE